MSKSKNVTSKEDNYGEESKEPVHDQTKGAED
jgi:hypothetical protein